MRQESLQAGNIEDADVFLLYRDKSLVLESGKSTTDGLQLEAEVRADFLARHA